MVVAGRTDSRNSHLGAPVPHSLVLVGKGVERIVHIVAVDAGEAVGGLQCKNYPESPRRAILEGRYLVNRKECVLGAVAEAG